MRIDDLIKIDEKKLNSIMKTDSAPHLLETRFIA
jgi:hypothetical protein